MCLYKEPGGVYFSRALGGGEERRSTARVAKKEYGVSFLLKKLKEVLGGTPTMRNKVIRNVQYILYTVLYTALHVLYSTTL